MVEELVDAFGEFVEDSALFVALVRGSFKHALEVAMRERERVIKKVG